ncbi:hypothetical protein EDD85DRAFT_866070 [Armillaria nabsnona]|nr:hypothetical protein EDD85DRAFT_866070 [Armillaria nabsnona]
MIASAHAAVVLVVFLVVLVVARFVFGSVSCSEMAVDVQSPSIIRTVGVCRGRVRWRLAPISVWGVLGRPGWGWGSFSWSWRRVACVGIVMKLPVVVVVAAAVDARIAMMPPVRAYPGRSGRIHAILGSWGPRMRGKQLKKQLEVVK